MPIEKSWEELIKLNLNCGCHLGVCKKCSPIIVIIKSLFSQQKQKLKEELLGKLPMVCYIDCKKVDKFKEIINKL